MLTSYQVIVNLDLRFKVLFSSFIVYGTRVIFNRLSVDPVAFIHGIVQRLFVHRASYSMYRASLNVMAKCQEVFDFYGCFFFMVFGCLLMFD